MTHPAHLEVALLDVTEEGLAHVSVLAADDEEHLFFVPTDALELLGPQPCKMTHTPPYDFAQCEKHDTTFALGDVCKFHNRDPWEVIHEEADAQRIRAVRAEHECDLAHNEVDRLRKEVEMLYERLEGAKDPVVLLVDKFTASCSECGRPADSSEKEHRWDNGCGRTFTHIGSRYFITAEFEDRLRAMRPDLPLTRDRLTM